MAQQTVEKNVTMTAQAGDIEIEYSPGPHTYRLRKEGEEWRDAISVTTALDVLNKGGLPWWGMRIGIQAMLTEWDRGRLRISTDGRLAVFGESSWEVATLQTVESLVKRDKLTVNHVRDDAGDRGNAVHDALEAWVKTGAMPVLDFYIDQWGNPMPEHGYVKGLIAFLTDLGELKSGLNSEVMVASYEHGYAGRYDLEGVLHGVKLCTKLPTPKWTAEGPNHHSAKGPEYETFEGRTIFDLKTPKGIFASHQVQLALYEGARLECGMPPAKNLIAVRVTEDGRYHVVKSRATFEDGLNVLRCARSINRIEKGV